MITNIEIKNFKSLREISFDLSNYGEGKNLALIYGENGAGKSHIISAIYMLLRTFRTLKSEDEVHELNSRGPGIYPELENEEIKYRLKRSNMNLKEIARCSSSIGSSDDISISISFDISGKRGSYSLVFSCEGKVIEESLYFQIGKRRGILFKYDESKLFLSPSVFIDKEYKKELLDIHQRYEGNHTFLSLLFSQWIRINQDIFENKVSINLVNVLDYLWGISVFSEEGKIAPRYVPTLTSGYSDYASSLGLDKMERLLNTYALKLFKDVRRVYYRTSYIGTRMYYELVFVREVGGRVIEIPYSQESKGIRQMLDYFPYVMSSLLGGISFVDGLDENLHDLVAQELIERISESSAGQIILTTHNTRLMQKVDRNYLYILKVDGHGYKQIRSISSYSFRTQKNNNVQIKYLHGDYEGIPLIEKLNFKALSSQIKDSY